MTTFAAIASGPSLRKEDIDYCIDKGWQIAACNNAAFLCERLDLFLAFDSRWWNKYGRRVSHVDEKWAPCPVIARKYHANQYKYRLGGGYSTKRANLYWGELSGYQLLQACSWYGAKRIIMLGYDMQHTGGESHYHGDHPQDWPNAQELERKKQYWPALARQAEQQGIQLINATRETALTHIPRRALESIR